MPTPIQNIEEISDSREMYEAKPHYFVHIFIYGALVIVLCISLWLYFGKVDIVAKGEGVVRPNENVSALRNQVEGTIKNLNIEEGKHVKKGDLLVEINHEDLEIQYTQAGEGLKDAQNTLGQMIKLRDSIEQEQNLFSAETEQAYYNRYIKYEQDYLALKNKQLIDGKNEEIDINEVEINKRIYEYKIENNSKEINELKLFEQSVQQEKNYFQDKGSKYALELSNLLAEFEALDGEIQKKKVEYDLNSELEKNGLVAIQELKDSEMALKEISNTREEKKISALQEAKGKREQLEFDLQLNQEEMSKLVIDQGLRTGQETQRELSIKQYKTDILVDLYNQIETLESKEKEQSKELESIKLAIANCMIIAPMDGKISITNEMSKGDFIVANTDICTIIPDQGTLYKVLVLMPNSEIANIKIGDKIQYRFDALPYKEYGKMTGTITNISVDAVVQNGSSGYYIEGTLDDNIVYGYNGKEAEIKVGMTCQANVVLEQKRILYLLLEKINLID